jgi:hypothetical protein
MKALMQVRIEPHGTFYATATRVEAAMRLAKSALAKNISQHYQGVSQREYESRTYWMRLPKTVLAVIYADLNTETV